MDVRAARGSPSFGCFGVLSTVGSEESLIFSNCFAILRVPWIYYTFGEFNKSLCSFQMAPKETIPSVQVYGRKVSRKCKHDHVVDIGLVDKFWPLIPEIKAYSAVDAIELTSWLSYLTCSTPFTL